MATVTPNVAQVFPVGTTVGAYPASGWPATALPPSGAAVPSATESQTVGSDGTLTFTTLAAGTTYFLGASVGGIWKYMRLVMPGGGASPRGSASDPISTTDDTELPAAAAPGDTDANSSIPAVAGRGQVWDGSQWVRARAGIDTSNPQYPGVSIMASNPADASFKSRAQSANGDGVGGAFVLGAGLMAHVGTTGLDRLRTPNVFKPLASTAITAGTGATIWTPTSGKKFRVMGISFSSSAAGQLLLGDNAVGTVIARSPSLAAGGVWQLGAADMGNGILSAAINNVLKMDGPTGNIMGMVWGIEE